MITLKLANYTQAEIDTLALLLGKMQSYIHVYCKQHENCLTCPVKNVCLDLNKAHSYCECATPYISKHRNR